MHTTHMTANIPKMKSMLTNVQMTMVCSNVKREQDCTDLSVR